MIDASSYGMENEINEYYPLNRDIHLVVIGRIEAMTGKAEATTS